MPRVVSAATRPLTNVPFSRRQSTAVSGNSMPYIIPGKSGGVIGFGRQQPGCCVHGGSDELWGALMLDVAVLFVD
jgi:hypothetical protein